MTARAEHECFVCDAGKPREAERPWEWAAPRVLCGRHDHALRLSDGQPLREVLARVAPLAALAQRRFPSILAQD
jgi:hypothetical protein